MGDGTEDGWEVELVGDPVVFFYRTDEQDQGPDEVIGLIMKLFILLTVDKGMRCPQCFKMIPGFIGRSEGKMEEPQEILFILPA